MITRRFTHQVTILIGALLFGAALLSQQQVASGQLIGNQTLGAPALSLTQQRSAGSATAANVGPGLSSNAVGSLGNRMQVSSTRFVRGNRSRQDFVGSNRTDLNGFVGSGQALGVGRVPSAVENLRIETIKTKINRPVPLQPNQGMYYPRLEIGFESTSTPVDLLSEVPINHELRERISQFSSGGASVTKSGNIAILRGTVSSTRASELLEQLLRFEPGIDRVRNELVIK